jgi:hypothetical protein
MSSSSSSAAFIARSSLSELSVATMESDMTLVMEVLGLVVDDRWAEYRVLPGMSDPGESQSEERCEVEATEEREDL